MKVISKVQGFINTFILAEFQIRVSFSVSLASVSPFKKRKGYGLVAPSNWYTPCRPAFVRSDGHMFDLAASFKILLELSV